MLQLSVADEAANAAQEAVRLVDTLIRLWEASPPPIRRAGGLSMNSLRITARALDPAGLSDHEAAFLVELAVGAGLLDGDGARYCATTLADDWDGEDTAARWGRLVAAWWSSDRETWLVGTRDAKGALLVALGTHPGHGQTRRYDALPALAMTEASCDLGTTGSPGAADPILAEATWLGLVVLGRLTSPAQRLLKTKSDKPTEIANAAANALRSILPEQVGELMLLGNLTGVIPGRPTADLLDLVATTADVESRGAALTVRFTAKSIERALDLPGANAAQLLTRLEAASTTGVPQTLEYLVRDVERRRASQFDSNHHAATNTNRPARLQRDAKQTLLRQAARDKSPVWIEFDVGQGLATKRRVLPLTTDLNRVRVLDPDRDYELTIALDHLHSVHPAHREEPSA